MHFNVLPLFVTAKYDVPRPSSEIDYTPDCQAIRGSSYSIEGVADLSST